MSISVEWFIDVPTDRKDQIEAALRSSPVIVRQLNKLLDRWENDLNAAESRISDYETPSWGEKQAHRNGDRSRIRKLRDLLSFLNK
jgi:hypothetical protein